MHTPGSWRTAANALTLLRLLAAPALAYCIATRADVAASLLFAVAVATDFADGWLARRRGEASPLGGLVDHAVDATFVTAGTAALAWTGVLPVVLPPLIALAFAQYALDSRLLGRRGLRASALGRYNGIGYFVALGTPVIRDALGLAWPGAALVQVLGWAFVATTLISVADRLRLAFRARATP